MKKSFAFLCFISLLFSNCQNTRLTSTDYVKMVESDIQKALDECVKAVTTKDIDLYMKGIPDDFILKDESGEVITREKQRGYALRDWSIIDTTLKNIYKVDSLQLFFQSSPLEKDSAVVYTNQNWTRLMFQRDGITKDTVLTTQRHKEIWKKNKNGWQNYEIEELGGEIFINGQLYKRQ